MRGLFATTALLGILGCGDYATNSELQDVQTDVSQLQAEVRTLQAKLDSVGREAETYRVLNTQSHSQPEGTWSALGGEVGVTTRWRLISNTPRDDGRIDVSVGITLTWRNGTGKKVDVSMNRIVFRDVNGILLAEGYGYSWDFQLQVGQTQTRDYSVLIAVGNVAVANGIVETGVYAGFTEAL